MRAAECRLRANAVRPYRSCDNDNDCETEPAAAFSRRTGLAGNCRYSQYGYNQAYACARVGRRQVVRHRVLIPAFAGSNPAGPATHQDRQMESGNISLAVFTGNANRMLAKKIAGEIGTPLGNATVDRFSDGEAHVEIHENVRGKDVFIVQPTCAPVNDHLMELVIMIDALHRASASRLTAVVPYFGYARQDRRAHYARVPISAKAVANVLSGVQVNRLLVVDLHADQIQGFFDLPVDNIYASPVLLEDIGERAHDNMIIVSPDVGGVVRARALARRLDNADLAIIDKRRPRPNQSEVVNIIGDVKGKACVLIDDIVDTAGTLCEAATALKRRGASKVIAYATHPVLSGNAVESVNHSELDELVVTDTIPLSDEAGKCKRIRVVSIAPILAQAIQRINREQSISSLFDV